jgi:hypothetical protein
MVMSPSEFFRPDQRINEISGDAGRDDGGEDIIQHRLQPGAGRDISDRDQEETGAGSQKSKVEQDAPPSEA